MARPSTVFVCQGGRPRAGSAEHGRQGGLPPQFKAIPARILTKPPSAELRPGQKDSDTLPPYEVLDNILEDYVEDYRTAEQIAANHGYEVQLVRDVIRMIERSEYKRQQAAPGLKITPKAFGFGRRFPIAQKSEV